VSTIREINPAETHLAYLAMRELRPHLQSLDEFVSRVNRDQRPEGYRLVGAFEDGIEEAVAALGCRIQHRLAYGSTLYVDDLSTREAYRRRGYGARLMKWALVEARRLGCDELHLDSGHQRHDAHRLYLNQGMHISSHHFRRVV
jgi:GNAT superfamily N-acetyltransferase